MPTFIQEAETSFSTTTTPKTTAPFDALAGDILVACGTVADPSGGATIAVTNSGTALTWAQIGPVGLNEFFFSSAAIWTTKLPEDRPGLTVTFTKTGTTTKFGGNVLTIRSAAQVGASSFKFIEETPGPTLAITTTVANSLIVVLNTDWEARDATSRVWRTGAGALSEVTYVTTAPDNSIYIGYHADAGSVGSKTVGLSAPGEQAYTIIAVEIVTHPVLPSEPGTCAYTKGRA